MKKIALSLIAMSAIMTTQANASTLFQCTTTNGKQIQLLDQGKTLQYSFGKVGKPEIVVKVPREQATYYPWLGLGRWYNYRLEIPNGDTSYQVFHAVDRNIDDSNEAGYHVEAGVDVTMPDGKTAQVLCNPNRKIINGLEYVTGVPKDS